ncbi:hypothetical protein [Rhodococcus triatomae]
MTVVNLEVTRQKLMQAAILNKVEREHLPLNTDRVRRSLQTVRDHVSRSPYFTDMLDRWEQIIDENDIEALRTIVESDDETGNEMRNLSPLHVLLTEDERMRVLHDLRDLIGQ